MPQHFFVLFLLLSWRRWRPRKAVVRHVVTQSTTVMDHIWPACVSGMSDSYIINCLCNMSEAELIDASQHLEEQQLTGSRCCCFRVGEILILAELQRYSRFGSHLFLNLPHCGTIENVGHTRVRKSRSKVFLMWPLCLTAPVLNYRL